MNTLHRIPPPHLLGFVLSCALPLGSSGCSQQACFFWTKAEGPCPSQAEALQFLASNNCDSPIESVDSEAEYDGELCCYDVTERGSDEILCRPPVPDTKPPIPGDGGIPSCQTCGSFLNNEFMGIPTETPCLDSLAIFDTLRNCLCEGPCQPACSDNICSGGSASTACFDCATDSAVGCGSQFSACVNDL
jgi:hypothetical protein